MPYQSCGTHFYNGSSWVHMNLGGDGGTSLINNYNISDMFAQINNSYWYTTNGGISWNPARNSFYYLPVISYNTPIIQHLGMNKIFLSVRAVPIGTNIYDWGYRVLMSTDDGVNWDQYGSKNFGNGRILAMAISKSDPDYFYLTTDLYFNTGSGWTQTVSIWKTTDNGNSWTDITSNLGSITTEAKMTAIEIDPDDPDKVWVSFGGLSAGKKIYVTSNGGSSWTNISYNLANLPLADIAYDDISNTIYVANDVGVYYMKDGNTSWQRMGDMPHAIVTGLSLNQSSRKLYTSTWGRGLWASDDLPEDECYDVTPLYISSIVSWHSEQNICQDVYMQNGGRLLLSADVTLYQDESYLLKMVVL